MNLAEFRKALSSDATEENAQLKKQLSDLQTKYHEKLSKLENENNSLKESCQVLCNRCFALTRGVTCLFCGLDYPCPHMPGLEEQVTMVHELRKEIEKMANGYRDALVQQIKDAGQELINRAETMVHPENDLITDFSIVIHFEQHEVPTIDYTTSVINKVACDRVIYKKGESNVSKI